MNTIRFNRLIGRFKFKINQIKIFFIQFKSIQNVHECQISNLFLIRKVNLIEIKYDQKLRK